MGVLNYSAAVLAAGVLLAQPCAAQSINSVHSERPPSAFAGINITLPLGTTRTPKPSVRLQFAADYGSRDRAYQSQNFKPRGLEIGLLETGKPTLFVNGRQTFNSPNQLGLGGSGSQTALIVGGVLVAVVVLAVAAGGSGPGDTCPTINGSRDHCINP